MEKGILDYMHVNQPVKKSKDLHNVVVVVFGQKSR